MAANLLRSPVPVAVSFLARRALPLVMLIAAEGGQAMLGEVSVVCGHHLGSPPAAAPVLRSAPEAGSLKCRDVLGW